MIRIGFALAIFLLTGLAMANPAVVQKTLAARSPQPPEASQVTLLSTENLPSDFTFQKTRLGGLSGLVWDESNQVFWAVSDDRGRVDEPRIYSLHLEAETGIAAKLFHVKLNQVVFLKEEKKKNSVLDLEGIAILPWGQLLFVNEGDLNHKPRANPRLMEFKTTGKYVRDYDLPDDFLAPLAGQQKKGSRNNMAFEGLAADRAGKHWMLAMEAPLLQDANDGIRLLEFTQPEAWVLKPGRQWSYPLQQGTAPSSEKKGELLSFGGVSEIIHAGVVGEDNEWWVLERQLGLGLQGLVFDCRLYSVRLGANTNLEKKLILDLGALGPSLNRNFEGMAWGPLLPDGRRVLILVSDNNFEKGTPTTFAFFAVKSATTQKPKTDHQEEGLQQ